MHDRGELFLIFITLCMKFKVKDNDKVKKLAKIVKTTL
jgi:hypothetical protein